MKYIFKGFSTADRVVTPLALLGLWLPTVLVVHFFVRLIGVEQWWGAVILAVTSAGIVLGDQSRVLPAPKPPKESHQTFLPFWDLTLCGLLLLSVTLPVFANYFAIGNRAPEGGYLFSDDAYEVEIAQGISRASFPPPDLGYAGRTLHYHYAHALALDIGRSYFGIPFHVSMYLVFPIICHLIMAGSIYRFMGLMVPASSVRMQLVATCAAGGIWTIEPLNVLWHLRVMATGSHAPWFGDLPMAVVHDCSQFGFKSYGALLVTTLLTGLLGNLDRCPIGIAAATLFAVFLSKSQLIIPVGLAWGAFAAYSLMTSRNWRPLAAGAAGLMFILGTKGILVPTTDELRLHIGQGFTFENLEKSGRAFVRTIGVDNTTAAVALSIFAKFLGLHVLGLALWKVLRDKGQSVSQPNKGLLCLSLGFGILAAIYATFVVLEPSSEIVAAFERIHYGIRDKLWLPYDGYLSRMMILSLGDAALPLASMTISLVSTGCLLYWYSVSGRKIVRFGLQIFVWSCLGVMLSRSATVFRLEQMRHMTVVPQDAVSCLAQIPVRSSIVLTNALAYDKQNAPHLPLLNAWAPAQFGHQFWACDFMYNANFSASDAEYRLSSLAWFWGTPYSDGHSEFLAKHGITHLFVEVSQLVNGRLPASDDLKLLSQSGDYAALEVTPKKGNKSNPGAD